MPLMKGYKQGEMGTEDETKLFRMKNEKWVETRYSHGEETPVEGGNTSGMKKNQIDGNSMSMADQKDY